MSFLVREISVEAQTEIFILYASHRSEHFLEARLFTLRLLIGRIRQMNSFDVEKESPEKCSDLSRPYKKKICTVF